MCVLRRFDEKGVIVVKAALEVFIQLNRRRAVNINEVFVEYAETKQELPFGLLVCMNSNPILN